MRAGETHTFPIRRRTPSGRPVRGKVLSDFAVAAALGGAAVSLAPSLAEIGQEVDSQGRGWGLYGLTLTLPATLGIFSLRIAPAVGGDQITPQLRETLLENYDLDALADVVVAPVVSVVTAGGPSGDVALRLVKNTYAPVSFTVRDQAGAAVNLASYTNAHFYVKNKTQASLAYDQTTGIAMTSGGLVTIGVPEAAAFYAELSPAGTDSVVLYWTFLADDSGDSAKTRCLARGTLTVVRTEA